jgi:hypothetical protein
VTEPWWRDDAELLAALGNALREAEAVPRSFVQAGKAAYAWHNIDAELAELAALAYDSAHEAPERAPATRAAQLAPLRSLTFASSQLSVHLEVTRDALHGQVVPAQPGEIELHPADGSPTTIAVDEVGWFVIRPIPTGSFSLRCRTAEGITVVTDPITL